MLPLVDGLLHHAYGRSLPPAADLLPLLRELDLVTPGLRTHGHLTGLDALGWEERLAPLFQPPRLSLVWPGVIGAHSTPGYAIEPLVPDVLRMVRASTDLGRLLAFLDVYRTVDRKKRPLLEEWFTDELTWGLPVQLALKVERLPGSVRVTRPDETSAQLALRWGREVLALPIDPADPGALAGLTARALREAEERRNRKPSLPPSALG